MSLSKRTFLNVVRRHSRCLSVEVLGKKYESDTWTNISTPILGLLPRKLHLQPNHPISILRQQIESQFPHEVYAKYNDYSPVVSTAQNFDSLGFPDDHVGRSKSDTYYIDKSTVLRTHTSAHQLDTFKECQKSGFLISADVYRRDEIDRSHYPAFHQMEGARSWIVSEDLVGRIERELHALPKLNITVEDPNPPNHETRNPLQNEHDRAQSEAVARHLKRTIEGIAARVFGEAASAASGTVFSVNHKEPLRVRWIEAYFPFTSPSWELEVWWDGDWLELCGCGVVRQKILNDSGHEDRIGWAFGLGLERIAMILFGIPDIRLFWSRDSRFLGQFQEGKITCFQPYSKYPINRKDISFWTATSGVFQENDFMEIVREFAGDLIEDVKLVDKFTHPKTARTSLCYRINYRSMDRSLSNEEISQIQDSIAKAITKELGVELR